MPIIHYINQGGAIMYLLLFLNIVFATLTESLFERVLGIQYYAIIVSVVLLKHYSSEFSKVKLVNNED